MYINTDIFKIETNHIVPTQGKILISEPFLCDHMFGRSVILLVDHAQDGTMGLILNKPLPLFLNDLLSEIDCRENIPFLPAHAGKHSRLIPGSQRNLPER